MYSVQNKITNEWRQKKRNVTRWRYLLNFKCESLEYTFQCNLNICSDPVTSELMKLILLCLLFASVEFFAKMIIRAGPKHLLSAWEAIFSPL